jgi:hypothetical protein
MGESHAAFFVCFGSTFQLSSNIGPQYGSSKKVQ